MLAQTPKTKALNRTNPLPLIINPPIPLIINTPQIWYTIIYWEYLLLGGWGGLLLGGGDYTLMAGKCGPRSCPPRFIIWKILTKFYVGDCQNHGPFLGPYYNRGPSTGPNLGDPRRDHYFDNPQCRILYSSNRNLWIVAGTLEILLRFPSISEKS